MNNETEDESSKKIDIFWTLVIFVGFNLIACLGIILGLVIDYLTFLIVLVTLNVIAILLSFIGVRKEKKQKKEIKSETTWATLFRKLINIVGALGIVIICFFLGPWMTFFVLIGFVYAFGLHEILFVKYDIKTIFTNTLLAFGRSGKNVFWPAINSLSSFSFVIGTCSIFFNFYFGPDFFWQLFLVATTSFLVWGMGDTTAYYTGKKWGSKKLPWNQDKSYVGSIGFFIVGSVIALLLLSPFVGQFILIDQIIGDFHWIWIAIITSLISAIVESLNIRITDNFTVPAISSLFLALAVIVF